MVLLFELEHHLLNFAVGYQAHHRIRALHQLHWVVVVLVRVRRGGTRLDQVLTLEAKNETVTLGEHGLSEHFEFS